MSVSSRSRFGLTTLLLAMLASALALAAATRFPAIAIRSEGIIAAAFMSLLGFVVGSVIGSQRGANMAALAVFVAFYWAVLNGLIPNTGDELTMWAFLCGSGGLAIGVLYRLSSASSSSATTEDSDDLRS